MLQPLERNEEQRSDERLERRRRYSGRLARAAIGLALLAGASGSRAATVTRRGIVGRRHGGAGRPGTGTLARFGI